jgi:hypothetical protein
MLAWQNNNKGYAMWSTSPVSSAAAAAADGAFPATLSPQLASFLKSNPQPIDMKEYITTGIPNYFYFIWFSTAGFGEQLKEMPKVYFANLENFAHLNRKRHVNPIYR